MTPIEDAIDQYLQRKQLNRIAADPRIKAIEYHPNGSIRRIEYHEPKPEPLKPSWQ